MKLNKFSHIIIFLFILVVSFYVYKNYREKTVRSIGENTLIVGTSADYQPFSYIENDTIVGLDIDIVKEVASRLGKKIVLKDLPFDMLLPEIQFGNIHVVAAGWTETPERAKRVLFTKPYLSEDPLLVVFRSNDPKITSLDDLNGKEIVVNEGYTADSYMSNISGPIIRRLPMIADGFLSLTSGRAFAFVTAGSVIKPFFDKYGKSRFNIFKIMGVSDSYSLSVSKKFPELLTQIQRLLDDMERDGTLVRLKQKWGVTTEWLI